VQLSDLDAVLFDMDGTLVNSDAAVERAWRRWASAHGLSQEAVLAYAQGVPAVDTVRRFRPDLDEVQVRSHADNQLAYERVDVSDVVPTPGALRALDVVRGRGLPWAVVTSADRALALARLGRCGIRPPVMVTVDDVTAGKPDPQGYLLGARLLDVDPARCLVVEDTDAGIAAGRAAGARVAALKGRPGDLRLRDLGELADLLDEPALTP
jgi:mannitol-1-/sugar-/sorbitol-6-phosphatase